MPMELVIAGGIVGLVGVTIGIVSGAWNLLERIAAARSAAKARKADRDYDVRDSFY